MKRGWTARAITLAPLLATMDDSIEIMPDKNKPFSEANRLVAIFGRPDLVNRASLYHRQTE
jgi:hypothetical protein